jgi:UDP-N-acetylmuramate dehydrogenase
MENKNLISIQYNSLASKEILINNSIKTITHFSNKILKIILKFLFIIIIFLIICFNYNNKVYNYSYLSKKSIKINVNNDEFIKNLKKILKDDEIIENEMMALHTTFKLGGPAKFFVKPKTINQIIEIIKLCNEYKVNYFILGNGSNLLVSDEGYFGVIIQIHEYNFSNLEIKKEDENNYFLKVGGGMLMRTLSIEACMLSLTGLEDIIDIPGTIGGGIIMNASFRGTGLIKPLEKVKVISKEGKVLELTKEECKLKHRGSMLKEKRYLVIEAIFKLKRGDQMKIQKSMTFNTQKRYEKQPMYFGSAGSFFVWNRKKYGSLHMKYKECNLMGYRVGNAMIYSFNISFIVNLGKANASDVMKIVKHIEKIIKEKYGIEMKREVVVIGTFNNFNYY